jgi:hypothetical protein
MRWILLSGLLLLCGCQYDFAIVQPPNIGGVIGSKTPLVVALAPVEYRFQASEGRLVMEVYNKGTDALEIDGQRSSVVDPSGLTHSIRGQLIPAGAFAKIILPPMRYDPGPEGLFHFGVWADASGTDGSGANGSAGPTTQPLYLGELDNPDDWDWHGETNIRVELTIERGTETFVHDFEFHRHKL